MKEKIKTYASTLTRTGFFHIFGSSVINKIVSFASAIILVRILTKPEYGVYSYAYNIYSFFVLLSGLGITSAMLQCCSENVSDEKRNQIYHFSCRFGLNVNTVLGAVILVAAFVIPLPINGANALLGIMCFLPTVTLIPELQRTYLHCELRNREYAYTTTFSTVTIFCFSCLFSFILRAKGLVLAHYLAAVASSVFIIALYKVKVNVKSAKLPNDEIKSILSLGFISTINNGLSRLMYLLDIFVLGIVIPDETVIAAYKVATTIPTALAFIPSALVTYIYPYFARHKDDKDWVTGAYKKLMLWFVPVNFTLSSLLIILAPVIIRLVFGEQYMDAVWPFRILCASYAISGSFRIIAGNLLVTQRKLKFNLYIAVFSSAMNTILNVFMIRTWASIGAALATLITVALTSVMNTTYLVHTFRKIKDNIEQG